MRQDASPCCRPCDVADPMLARAGEFVSEEAANEAYVEAARVLEAGATEDVSKAVEAAVERIAKSKN